jgi:hypothetical protein
MKKTICILVLITAIFVSCKKGKNDSTSDDPTNPGTATGNTTPAYVPPQPGSLKVSVSSLTLHPGDNTSLVATLYNVNGSVIVSPPSLIWNTSDANVASVNNGLVTANTLGNCDITVTDGIHGILRIDVSVVSSSLTIPSSATTVEWPYAGNTLVMKTDTIESVTNYTVYNSKGMQVSAPLTFIAPSGSGLIFSGNSVTSGSLTGCFNILVKSGNDTLENSLKILVVNTDTVYSFDIVQGSLSRGFNKNGVASANPLMINVTKSWNNGGPYPQKTNYVTSPDKIELYGDGSVTLNSQGKFESVKPSTYLNGTLAKIIYKNVYLYRELIVCVNISGNWGVNMANGDTYNYCISQTGPDIFYYSNEFIPPGSGGSHFISGTYRIIESGQPVTYGPSNIFTGTYRPTALGLPGYNSISITNHGTFSIANENQIYKVSTSGITYLQRGAGNCTGSTTTVSPCPGDSLALLNLLISGGSSTTWLTSSCYSAESGISSYTFNNDFTGSFQESTGMHTMSWKIRKATAQTGCVYEFYAWKIDGSTTSIPFIGESFLPPYTGTQLQLAQPGTSCSPNSYYFTKQ